MIARSCDPVALMKNARAAGSQTFVSWNQVAGWLRQLNCLRIAA
jgi:hypothetical protein